MSLSHRRRITAAALFLAVPLTLTLTACGNDQAGATPKPTPTTVYEGSYTSAAAKDMIGNGTFAQPEDADRSDVESTAEVAALMLHSWDTTTDKTQTAAAIRAIPLMSNEWATNQIEPERNANQGAWLEPSQHQAYSAPSVVAAPGDVSQDVAADKAIRAYDVSWRWISRDGEELTASGRQIVTIYLEQHDDRWDVVGHQLQDMGR
ncbi:hypothetical protein IWX75_003219 [Arthrobacter sp. CAN_A6]|uniref:hypothetical protein n=1 Tax=Arthrobacter sp. CAN_A6 TaxID=2787721 RepID=UPI0018C9A79F